MKDQLELQQEPAQHPLEPVLERIATALEQLVDKIKTDGLGGTIWVRTDT